MLRRERQKKKIMSGENTSIDKKNDTKSIVSIRIVVNVV